ncbi:hypothetical protein HY995_03930 [Candidatus Micrarchaeota archaeon]|nr:hypothetical protein [Candidatus Micrarchaeota archaeon]MBI5177207.1 hypothetical protein [Candidatus Micrarchaeota archaeon]
MARKLALAIVLLVAGLAIYSAAQAATCDAQTFQGVCILHLNTVAPDTQAPSGGGGWHTNIITTVFSDKPYGAALPSSKAKGRTIEIRGRNGRTVTTTVTDVGPFCGITKNGDDDAYVFGTSRPFAEKNIGVLLSKLNSGCNGKWKSTGASLDVTRDLALKLGIDGKGYADWRFV